MARFGEPWTRCDMFGTEHHWGDTEIPSTSMQDVTSFPSSATSPAQPAGPLALAPTSSSPPRPGTSLLPPTETDLEKFDSLDGDNENPENVTECQEARKIRKSRKFVKILQEFLINN